MSQDTIVNHLLKVGSSRYQDPKFREKHPLFSPISRFGIGVLSSFMVADAVEIVTATPDKEPARQISLRSVHGKYLIRILDKENDEDARLVGAHGTMFKIKFRASVQEVDLLQTARKWVVVPRCEVTFSLDGGPPERIGYSSPKEALEYRLKTLRQNESVDVNHVKIEEKTIEGVTLAYALRYNSLYRNWSFMSEAPPDFGISDSDDNKEELALSMTCIEGIAVEFTTPGFRDRQIIAIANAIGPSAPRTNVARSMIEETSEREDLCRKVYNALFQQVSAELQRLQTEEKFSKTWAAGHVDFVLGDLFNRRNAMYPDLHRMSIENLPMFLVENGDKREVISLSDLKNIGNFWTLNSMLMDSVEFFVREAKSHITARHLFRISQGSDETFPSGLILSNLREQKQLPALDHRMFEVNKIVGRKEERRLDLYWTSKMGNWISLSDIVESLADVRDTSVRRWRDIIIERTLHEDRPINIEVPKRSLEVVGLEGYNFALDGDTLYVLPGIGLHSIFTNMKADTPSAMLRIAAFLGALSAAASRRGGIRYERARRYLRNISDHLPEELLMDRGEIEEAIAEIDGELRIFNPQIWSGRYDE
jgi:hypothetical protein